MIVSTGGSIVTLAAVAILPRDACVRRARRAAGVLILLLLAVVAACWAIVALFGAFPGDREISAEVAEENLGWWGLLPARVLDWLGDPVPATLVVVVAALATGRALGWRHAVLVVAASAAAGVALALKALFDRERPPTDLELDGSYPSGHTAYARAVFGIIAVMLLVRRRWVGAFCAAAIAGAMGPSRSLLGVHWTSDVIAGYAVGLAWLVGVLAAGWGWARRDEAGDDRRSAPDQPAIRRPCSTRPAADR